MITIEELEKRLEHRYGCSVLKDIKSSKRDAHIFALRLIYYYICINNGISKNDAMVRVNKSRVNQYHYDKVYASEYKYNAEFKELVDDLLKE